MTRPLLPRRSDQKPLRSENGGGGSTAMRLIVPLQGVVQGHGGLVFGSLLPCALFYLLQFYLKRQRPSSSPPPPASPSNHNLSGGAAVSDGSISRSLSRGFLSPRGHSAGPSKLSSRGAALAPHEDDPYYLGLKLWSADAYHPLLNPGGVIQLGLSDNQLSFDWIRDWVSQQTKKGLMLGGLEEEVEGQLSIKGLAPYQPYDGCMDLKMVNSSSIL